MQFNFFTGRKTRSQERAEDVTFTDIFDSPDNTPKIDRNARARQLSDAIGKRATDLAKSDPIAALSFVTLFSAGAHWADKNPVCKFLNRKAWIDAQRAEVNKLIENSSANSSPDLVFETVLLAMFAEGANWADNNPAPTLR